MGTAVAEFLGGPCDGRIEEVPRGARGQLPRELTFKTLISDREFLGGGDALEVQELVYRLRADVGPTALYDFDSSR